MYYKITNSNLVNLVDKYNSGFGRLLRRLNNLFRNPQSKERAAKDVFSHYGIGNELFQSFLDPSMTYSCAYWREGDTLQEAQMRKYDLICKKLNLQRGQKILDIGCGWGGFAKYAAENYDVSVVGVTIVPNQVSYAREYCEGLPVVILEQDYRDIQGEFDHIISIGMFEHVGTDNHKTFMQCADRLLKKDGFILLHTIGSNVSKRYTTDLWTSTYIFPNSLTPSNEQIERAIDGIFVEIDRHEFDFEQYDKTLMTWGKNFDANYDDLSKKHPKYNNRFYRTWRFFLYTLAGSFRSGHIRLRQYLLHRKQIPKYKPVR